MRNRYLSTILSKKGKAKKYPVHRLVGIHFIPNPENKPEINHMFGNKLDNRACVLEWSTRKENAMHAYMLNLVKTRKGCDCYNTNMTPNQIIEIRERHKNGELQKDLARQYNSSRASICRIVNFKRYK